MDYQQMNQPTEPVMEKTEPDVLSKKNIIISIVAIAVVALITWYFMRGTPATQTPPVNVVSDTSTTVLSGGDTTEDIAKDMDNIPVDSAVTGDIKDLDTSIQSF